MSDVQLVELVPLLLEPVRPGGGAMVERIEDDADAWRRPGQSQELVRPVAEIVRREIEAHCDSL